MNKNMHLMCLCYSIFGVLSVYPTNVRSYPHQTMMVSGYYGRPRYLPQGAMTAFATRDAVASNSWSRDENLDGEADGDVVKRPETKPDITETTQDEATVQEQEITTKRVPKNKQKPTRPQLEAEDEEEESVWPMRHNGVPAFNAFFPIIFGGRGGGHQSGGGAYPGSATAIANSFSTGRGGVASSHAIAYGDPYLNMLLRSNGEGNTKMTKKATKQE